MTLDYCGKDVQPNLAVVCNCCEYHATAYQQATAYMSNWYPPRALLYKSVTYLRVQERFERIIAKVFGQFFAIAMAELDSIELVANEPLQN